MENSQSQTEPEEEMSFEQKISEDFNKAGHSRSHRQTLGQEGGGSAFPHDRLVILSLGLLNAVLLITAAVIGIYCAKANDHYLQIPHSAATSLTIELNYLRNHSEIIKAKLEAEAALARERASHVQLKLQVKAQKTLSDVLQSQIETLLTEKTKLKTNKTAIEESCGRCLPGWVLLKSSCYYFSVSNSQKNWPDSRADCISRGGDLLVINNLEEQQLMSDNLPKSSTSGMWWQNGFWIGLTDVVIKGTWVWINNVTEVETMYWKAGQPSQSGAQSGNCAALFYYDDNRRTWYNGNCRNHLFNWICEMESS